MQNLESLKAKGQESFSNLLERGKEQPDEVKQWGVTAAAGVGGALAVAAVSKGVLAILSTLASPPVALTVGAIGGGALGWNWIKQQTKDAGDSSAATADTATDAAATTASAPATTPAAAVPETPTPYVAEEGDDAATEEGSA